MHNMSTLLNSATRGVDDKKSTIWLLNKQKDGDNVEPVSLAQEKIMLPNRYSCLCQLEVKVIVHHEYINKCIQDGNQLFLWFSVVSFFFFSRCLAGEFFVCFSKHRVPSPFSFVDPGGIWFSWRVSPGWPLIFYCFTKSGHRVSWGLMVESRKIISDMPKFKH